MVTQTWRTLATALFIACGPVATAVAGPYLWHRGQDTVARTPRECAGMARKVLEGQKLSGIETSDDGAFGYTRDSTVAISCITTVNKRVTAIIMIASTSDEGKQLLGRLSEHLKKFTRID